MEKNNETRLPLDFGECEADGQHTEAPSLDALNDDSISIESKKLDRAKRTLQSAAAWRYQNPQAWAHIVSSAMEQAASGENKRISVRQIKEEVCRKDYVDVNGKPCPPNNDFTPVFARWLVADHPSLSRYIELRKCPLDEVM